ncbi:MAG: aminomethyl-transferring glycine dehydrogenase [Bacteroidales bacterium]|nr:aminomethyl-transferring glycine dehydrogenase [Bacteroidales bacterium]
MEIDKFEYRHIGPRHEDVSAMCKTIGVNDIDELIEKTIPSSIRLKQPLRLPPAMDEKTYLQKIRQIASKNKLYRTYIGMGYYGTHMPAVIQRNILENPSWYTSYTPYQAEISQGRLEALLNFQTVVIELTGMDIANASLLDEATAAAEAMTMMYNSRSRDAIKNNANKLFVDQNIFPQTLAVTKTRAIPFNIEVIVGDFKSVTLDKQFFGAIVQYPAADGSIPDYNAFAQHLHEQGILLAVAADPLSLALLPSPGSWGADIVFGSTQRFGIPLGFGGPHAAYFASKEEFKRNMPGRIIGVSVDAKKRPALRMALQTREQHIKRERATSNICTAQALLATMAGMYVVYHGYDGLKRIANHIHQLTATAFEHINALGYQTNTTFFDTLTVKLPNNIDSKTIEKIALSKQINLAYIDAKTVRFSFDELTTNNDVADVVNIFAEAQQQTINQITITNKTYLPFIRTDEILKQHVFNAYRSETELMRYIKKLERKDISLTHSMISLGSCTMKLNAAAEMLSLTMPEFAMLHPFVPKDQAEGYYQIMDELGYYLKNITGFDAISFQPNSGAAGEYAGLMVIRKYHEKNGQHHRNVILIPSSAHGTNPASAAMAGMKVVVVECDENGNIDVEDLKKKAEQYRNELSGLMVTYPSTHGVFEEAIIEIIQIVHQHGGLVYMDGANMNAQVGITSPATIDADVCHLNLHKTFAIPHGGGGPGAGPILVKKHLEEFLPQHPIVTTGGINGVEAVAAAPFGSALILLISHAYITMMGADGLLNATKYAILNANYLAAKLKNYYKILYTGKNGFIAHEMILDCRKFKELAQVNEIDIAKRLMDYGYHAPTVSFPVHGTLMVEPTESESKQELDRFAEALIQIYHEIMEIADGKYPKDNNVLVNAPHPAEDVIADEWNLPYSRTKAAYALPWVPENKFFPAIARIDDAYGDRNLVCSCTPIDQYRQQNFEVLSLNL